MTIRRSLFWFSLVSLLSATQGLLARERAWPGKRLSETWPTASKFTQKLVVLDAPQMDWVEKSLGTTIRREDRSPVFYSATSKEDQKLGVVLFVDATGENGTIEIGLAIGIDGKVTNVVLFENSESKDLNSNLFLSTFTGKQATDPIILGTNTTSDKAKASVSLAVRRGLLLAVAGQMVRNEIKTSGK